MESESVVSAKTVHAFLPFLCF